jgi:DNA invertase Pin-like site-specific DNA recombinase
MVLLRHSTMSPQCATGGLHAQRQAVMTYLNGGPWKLIAEFTEVETGKRADRPELQKALAACRKHKGKLVIAKLDRLSRNFAFIATLMDSNVEFIAADNPHANSLTVHILGDRRAAEQRTTARRCNAFWRVAAPALPAATPYVAVSG